MKTLLTAIAALAMAGAAVAQVNPARPMVTGRGNVSTLPSKVIVTNQTEAKPEEAVKLEKFVVTGSLMKHPAAKAARVK